MDPLLNPYRPGAGAPPPILAGREDELEAIETLLGRLSHGRGERSVVLTGLRGVGKTALLWAAEGSAEERGWIAQSLEARAGLGFRAVVAERAWAVLRRLEHKGAVREALARLTEMIRRVGMRDPATGVELSVDLAPPDRAGDLEADLVDLFRALGEAAAATGTGVLFLLDELQEADPRALEALCAAMHDLSKRELPVAALIAGLPPLRGQLLAAKTYAERLFAYRELGPLSASAATAALVEPARASDGGLEFDGPAVDLLLEACGGYPYFVQVYGHAAWNVAKTSQVGVEEAKEALSLGRRELDGDLYAGRWNRASDRGRRYMAAMALLGDGPVGSGVAAEALGGHRAASPTREQLIEEGLIYSPERGQVAFTVPGFADFVRRTRATEPSTA